MLSNNENLAKDLAATLRRMPGAAPGSQGEQAQANVAEAIEHLKADRRTKRAMPNPFPRIVRD